MLLRTDSKQQILGFYSLAQHGYRDSELSDVTARVLKVQGLKSIPMILLGQLGIATDFQSRGLGRLLLRDALARSLSVAQEIGGVAIITDPYDAKVRHFYARFGFQVLHEHPFLRMLLPMRTLAKSVAQIRARGASSTETERL